MENTKAWNYLTTHPLINLLHIHISGCVYNYESVLQLKYLEIKYMESMITLLQNKALFLKAFTISPVYILMLY